MSTSGIVPIMLDDLPRHSAWPKRLLGLEPYAPRRKTEEEVYREYEDDKWGVLLQRMRAMPRPVLEDVERAHVDLDSIAACYDGGVFYLASYRHILDRHLDLYAEVLSKHLMHASCVVELGAGYGSKLLALANRGAFAKLPLMAAEYAPSGRDLMALLADTSGTKLAIGACDFWNLAITGLDIPENAVIFTSYAVHYVPELSTGFVNFLARLRPKAVVHFEPCYEHYPMDSLHGMMCRRYVELNDYTRNLVSVLESARHRGEIVLRMRENVLGGNPFLPVSVIEWSPAGRSDSRK